MIFFFFYWKNPFAKPDLRFLTRKRYSYTYAELIIGTRWISNAQVSVDDECRRPNGGRHVYISFDYTKTIDRLAYGGDADDADY